MSKFDDSMSDLLDVTPTTPVVIEPTQVATKSFEEKTSEQIQNDLMKDYEESRQQLKDIVSKGAGAIDDILAIARESEHPRAFEVAATMIKTVADANEKLLGMQKQMKDITGQKNTGQLNVGKAAIFVGSTAELSKMIKNEMKIIDGDS
jgi:tetrahydromethanopterin S-methyltransferase subunit A